MTSKGMTVREATRLRLEELSGPVFFSDLQAHLKRDAVFIVAPGLSLVDCGVAIAMDEVDRVRDWIAGGELRKPSRRERDAWPCAEGRRWRSVVVDPFVLVQDD